MAMLFALVAAMFISIVPVKAEAATCTDHVDADHNYACDTVGCSEHVHHADTEVPAKDATCTEAGNKTYYKCDATGCAAISEFKNFRRTATFEEVTLEKKGHAPGDFTVTEANHISVCVNCGTALGNAESHTIAYEVDGENHIAYCTVCKYKAEPKAHVDDKTNGNCICNDCGAALAHNWADWGKDANSHWKSCLNGNCKETTSVGAHEYEITSNENGVEHTKTCKTCGYAVVEACTVNDQDCKCSTCEYPVKHFYSWTRMVDGYKEPTCTKSGMVDHKVCELCGLRLKSNDQVVTAEEVTSQPLGHAYNKGFSCDDEKHYYRCTRTGCEEKDQSAEHVLVYTNNGDGTHTGKCKDCGREPAAAKNLKHNYGKPEAIDGKVHKLTCTDCGYAPTQSCADTEGEDCLCDGCGSMIHHLTAMLETIDRKEPTCTEKGNIGYHQCKTCKKIFSGSSATGYTVYTESVELAALGHAGNKVWEKDSDGHYQWCYRNCGTKLTDVTGETEGVAAHTYEKWNPRSDNKQHDRVCTACGYTDVAKHVYGAPEGGNGETHKVTCTDCGYATRQSCVDSDADTDCQCDGCGDMVKHDRADLDYIARVNPTCTENGNVGYYVCKTCARNFDKDGEAFVVRAEDVVLKALDHEWEEGTETDSTTGKHIESCEREGCKAVRALAHDDKNGDCKCDINNCGKLIHSHDLVFHNPVPAACGKTGVGAYYTYKECDKGMFAAEKLAFGGYVAGKQISAAPVIDALECDKSGEWTPAENGMHEKYCTRCEAVVDSGKHDFSEGIICSDCGAHESLKHREAKPATCTEAGNKEYWYSDISGKVFRDAYGRRETTLEAMAIAELGHQETGWVANGSNHKETCQRPGCTWSREENHVVGNNCTCKECGGNVAEHEMTFYAMEPATCTKVGYEAYYECDCGKLYDMGYKEIKAPGVIKALGHDMNSTLVQDTKEGKHYNQCKNCSYKIYNEHTMVLSDPNKGNYHQWMCACGMLEIEKHYDKNGDKKCDACAHNQGGTSIKVEQHDNVTVQTGQKDTVQNNKTWLQNWLESLNANLNGGNKTASKNSSSTANSSASTTNSGSSATTNSGSTSANTGSTSTNSGNASTNSGSTSTNNGGNASTNSGSTSTNNGGSTSNGTANESTVAIPSTGTPSTSTTETAPVVEQASVIVQFVNWFLGLFGF